MQSFSMTFNFLILQSDDVMALKLVKQEYQIHSAGGLINHFLEDTLYSSFANNKQEMSNKKLEVSSVSVY